jgi:hypothetical protein
MVGVDHKDRATRWATSVAILLLVAAFHAAFLLELLAGSRPGSTALRVREEDPLVFLLLPQQIRSATKIDLPGKISAEERVTESLILLHPHMLDQQKLKDDEPNEHNPAVDWRTEAALAAQHQTQLAAMSQYRSLDSRGKKANLGLSGELGSAGAKKSEFGWDYAATHRVQSNGVATVIALNDRCSLVLAGPIPFPICGIGKIPPRGDLFDHMHVDIDSDQDPPQRTDPPP